MDDPDNSFMREAPMKRWGGLFYMYIPQSLRRGGPLCPLLYPLCNVFVNQSVTSAFTCIYYSIWYLCLTYLCLISENGYIDEKKYIDDLGFSFLTSFIAQ